MEEIGRQRLRYLRVYTKKTQKEFADDLGIYQSVLSRIENGSGSVGYDLTRNAVERYNVLPEWLLGLYGETEKPLFREGETVVPKSDYQQLRDKYVELLEENRRMSQAIQAGDAVS